MDAFTRIFSALKRPVLYGISAITGVLGMLCVVFLVAVVATRLAQPSDEEISLESAPHDKNGVRVWRLPTKELKRRLPPRKEA